MQSLSLDFPSSNIMRKTTSREADLFKPNPILKLDCRVQTGAKRKNDLGLTDCSSALQTTKLGINMTSTRNTILEKYNSKLGNLGDPPGSSTSVSPPGTRTDLKQSNLENILLKDYEKKRETNLKESNILTPRSSSGLGVPKAKKLSLQTKLKPDRPRPRKQPRSQPIPCPRKRGQSPKKITRHVSKKRNLSNKMRIKSKQHTTVIEEDFHQVGFDEDIFASCTPIDLVESVQNESILTSSSAFQVDLSTKKEMNKRKLNLLNIVAGSLLRQPKFKEEDDQTRLLIMKAVKDVIEMDAEFILKACLYTRRELNIRTTSNFLLSLASFKIECRPYVKKYFSQCIMLPSDWIEVAEIYQTLGDIGINFGSLPAALRKAMIAKFPDFDEYQLAKYNKDKKSKAPIVLVSRPLSARNDEEHNDHDSDMETEELLEVKAPTLKQLIRKLHISEPAIYVMGLLGKKYPDSSEGFYKSHLSGSWDSARAGKRMKLATPETWETQVSSKGNKASTWEQLIDNKKLPFMAMLRNLRNMIKAGIDQKHHAWVQRKLSDERTVINSKQFPFRFFSAYAILDELEKELQGQDEPESDLPPKGRFNKYKGKKKKKPMENNDKSAKYDEALLEKYRKSLDTALKISTTHNVKPLPGCTYVLVDVSESLNVPCTSARGLGKPRTVLEMGILMGLMCKYSCESCQFVLFNDQENIVVVDYLCNGTILKNMQVLLDGPIKEMNEMTHGISKPIWALDILQKDLKVDNLILLGAGNAYMRSTCSQLLDVYRLKTGNDVLAVDINLTGCEPEFDNEDNFIHVSGYSDQILRFIAERSSSGQVEHVDNIDKVYKLLSLKELGIVSKGSNQNSKADSTQELSKLYCHPTWRTIKIFISSTFRDMHGERDLLTRFVMPNIRKYASSMNMNVYEIDLRWGITEQEAKSDRQLEICLTEVEKADIFLCMLGNRYGYIPDHYSVGNTDNFAWLADFPSGRSITELEIYTFALRNPQKAFGRAFFYFRDDAISRTIPDKFKSDFCIESETHQKKLDSLKQQIVNAGHSISNSYPAIWGGVNDGKPVAAGLEKFATMVFKDLTFGLKRIHNENVSEDVSMLSASNSSFAKEDVISFVGRKSVLRNVKTFIDCKDGGVVLIAGKQGSGKTAIMTQIYKDLKKENSNTFCHFASMTSDAIQPITILKSLITDLANHYQLSIPIPTSYGDLASIFIEFIRLSCEETGGRKLTILIDGIDLIESLQLHWLPSPLPKGVVIIMSCIENGPAYKMLASRYRPEVIKLGSLDVFEKAQLVRNILLMYRKRLDESPFNNQMKLLLAKRDSIFPVYLKLVCDDLRIYSVFEQLSKHLRELAPTTTLFLDNLLNRLDSSYDKDLVAFTFVALALSHQGLSEYQLYDIVNCANSFTAMDNPDIDVVLSWYQSGVPQIPRASFAKLLLSTHAIIARSTSGQEKITISSKEISDVILKRYSTIDKRDIKLYIHTVLAGYYLSKSDCYHNGSWQGSSRDALTELPKHLIKANLKSKLEEMLCNLKFIKAKFEAGCGHQLIEDFMLLSNHVSVTKKQQKLYSNSNIEAFSGFVMKNSHILCKYPQLVVQQALNYTVDEFIVSQARQMLDKETMIIECLPGTDSSMSPVKSILLADEVTCISSSKDSTTFAVGLKTGSVRIYSSETFKEEQVFRAHTCSVTALCYLDKLRLCTCSEDGNIKIWNTRDLYRSHSIVAHRRAITHVVATSDGRQLITSGLDYIAKVYNSVSGDDIGRFTLTRPASFVSISTDDKFAAIACWDGTITIWNFLENKRLGILKGHEVSVQCCCFAPNGKHIASADIKGNIFIWSYLSQIKVGSISNSNDIITRLAYFNNGKDLVGTCMSGNAKIWSSSLGMLVETVEPLSTDRELALTVAIHDNHAVAIGYHSGTVQIYNPHLSTWESIKAHTAAVQSICWSSKGDMVVTGSADKLVKLFSNNKCYATFNGHSKPVKHVAWSTAFVASCSEDFTVMLWAVMFLDNGAIIDKPHAVLRGHNGPVSSCAFSPLGDKLLSVSYDQSLIVWDVETVEQLIKVNSCHSDWVTACAWSDVGDFIVTGSRDFTLKLWDSKTGKEKKTFIGHQSAINSVSYKYGCVASACFDGSVKLWTEKGIEVSSVDAHSSRTNACVLGDRKAIAPSTNWADVVDTSELSRNQLVRTTKPKHDNIILYTASDDGLVKVWSPFMANLKKVLKGHSGCVTDVASFGEKDYLLATVSKDKSISLWDVEKVHTSEEGTSQSTITCVCFNKDGLMFAYCTSDGHVIVKHFSNNFKVIDSKVSSKANFVCFSASGNEVMVACQDGSLVVCPINGTTNRILFKHNTSLLQIACNRTSVFVVAFDEMFAVKIKNAKRSKDRTRTLPFCGIVNCAISSDSKCVIYKDGNDYRYFQRYKDREEFDPEFELPIQTDNSNNSFHLTTVCRWKKKVVCGFADGNVRCYVENEVSNAEILKIHDACITAIEYTNDMIISASTDKTLKIHDRDWKLIGIFFFESYVTTLNTHTTENILTIVVGEESGMVQRLQYNLKR